MKHLFRNLLLILCLFSCTKMGNGSAATFFDFVCRDCNYLQVTIYHSPQQLGRTGPVQHQSASGAAIGNNVYLLLELVPWNPEETPGEEDLYSGTWRTKGDAATEENILHYYRREKVRAFEHIEYRKEGLANIEITSSITWATFPDMVEYKAGESLNELFDVLRIYNDYEEGYDDLLLSKGGKVISKLPDRIPLTEYLKYDTRAFSSICLFLKKDVFAANGITIRITLDDGRILEHDIPYASSH